MLRGVAPTADVYTVSRLAHEVRELLERSFPPLWVEGEISNLARPGSGHLYFSLKDADCQVRCAMFRSRNQHLRFAPREGMLVLAHARVSLYPGRGEFQLIVDYLEEAGAGALRRRFELLKARLAAEGLFDTAHKRPLPSLPRRIGVVTSPDGAAIRDILHVLERRFPAVPVLVYPVPVQGPGAAAAVARALRLASERGECDVLILARGGGSLEDLWAFNEESIARAIHACRIPVVTGIGHEVDYTIADLAADCRAPTPSAAAELVTPDARECGARAAALGARLARAMANRLERERRTVGWLEGRLVHPLRALRDRAQRLDDQRLRLERALRAGVRECRAALAVLSARLARHHPRARLDAHRSRALELERRLEAAARNRVAVQRTRLVALARALEAVGPQATLDRGYAIVTRHPSGEIVRDAGRVIAGEAIRARVARGSLLGRVEAAEESVRPPGADERAGAAAQDREED